MFEFTPKLVDDSDEPLYLQLYKYIKNEIRIDKIEAGTKLPSIRKLAAHLQLSRNTIESAYQQLIAEGYVESRQRSGLFAVDIKGELFSAPNIPPAPSIIKGQKESGYPYDFRYGKIDVYSFPITVWRKLSNQCMRQDGMDALIYGDPQGEPELRYEIVKYLHQARGVYCSEDQVIIGAGTQQLLGLLCQLLGLNEHIVAMEEPGYDGAKAVFSNHGFRVQPVPLDEDGINIDQLIRSAAKIAYVTPSHQFPSGMIMSISKRMRLLQWACEHDGLILEDDYDGEFRYSGKPIPSLQGLDSTGKVVYFGTFSKSLLPSIRIGYMVLPASLMEIYEDRFQAYGQTVSKIHQLTLSEFMKNGYFERHIRKMRTVYLKRHNVLLSALKEIMGIRVKIIGEDSGLHLLIEVKSDYTEEELIARAARGGVRVYPSSRYWSDPTNIQHPTILLGFGGMTEEDNIRGVELLHKLWFKKD